MNKAMPGLLYSQNDVAAKHDKRRCLIFVGVQTLVGIGLLSIFDFDWKMRVLLVLDFVYFGVYWSLLHKHIYLALRYIFDECMFEKFCQEEINKMQRDLVEEISLQDDMIVTRLVLEFSGQLYYNTPSCTEFLERFKSRPGLRWKYYLSMCSFEPCFLLHFQKHLIEIDSKDTIQFEWTCTDLDRVSTEVESKRKCFLALF